MKEEIEAWKRMNGNVTYTTKELIQGVIIRIDKLEEKLDFKCEKKCNSLKNMIVGMFTLLFSLIGGLASYVFFGGK